MYPPRSKVPPRSTPTMSPTFFRYLAFHLSRCCQKNISHPPEKTQLPLFQNVRHVSLKKNTEKEKPQPKTISELVFIGISEKGIHDFLYPNMDKKYMPPPHIIKITLIPILYT